MIILKATTESLQLTTSTTAGVDYSVSYADITTTSFSPSTSEGKISTATTTTIVSAPSASTQRQIKLVTISNRDASLTTVVFVQKLITATTYMMTPTLTLLAGETLQYLDGKGWVLYSASGQIKAEQSAGGSDTQIQLNSAGTLSGDADFTWDKTVNTLSLSGVDTGMILAGITTEPSAPPAGTLRYYSKSIAGKMFPKIKGPSGLDTPLQNAFWQNNTTIWTPTTASAGFWQGTTGSGAGTYTTALPTTTSSYTAMKRGRWTNIVTTVNQILGQRNTELMYISSPSNAGQGGFFFYARLGFDVWTNGARFFAGFHTATTVISANPSLLNNTVGFCVDDTDNGLISFLTRSTTATKTSTGFTIVSGKGYDVYITCLPGTNTYSWRIVDINAGVEANGTTAATVPAANTMLSVGVLASNAALTPVTSVQLGLNRIYVESDY